MPDGQAIRVYLAGHDGGLSARFSAVRRAVARQLAQRQVETYHALPYSTHRLNRQRVDVHVWQDVLRFSQHTPVDALDIPCAEPAALVAALRFGGAVCVWLEPAVASTALPNQAMLRAVLARAACIIVSPAVGAEDARRFGIALSDDRVVRLDDVAQAAEAYIGRLSAAQVETSNHVVQVVSTLLPGDAVSAIVAEHAATFAILKQPADVLVYGASESNLAAMTPDRLPDIAGSHAIMHYAGYTDATWLTGAMRGRKALYYHNITPPTFFAPGSAWYTYLRRSYVQLAAIVNRFDVLIGDSRYNIEQLRPLLEAPKPVIVIHPVVEVAELTSGAIDGSVLERMRQTGGPHVLFVGRVAPNKRQDALMRAFDRFWRAHGRQGNLWLVGSTTFDVSYTNELLALRESLEARGAIYLAGKVSDTALRSYFRGADVFVSASEHEGFCIPVAEAMAFGVPVIARGAGAVPETLGDAGVLLERWDDDLVAQAIGRIARDAAYRTGLIDGQRRAVARFSRAAARSGVRLALDLLHGKPGAMPLEILEPGRVN